MFLRKNGASEKIEAHLAQSPTQKKQIPTTSKIAQPPPFNFSKNILVPPRPPPTARNYDSCSG